MASCSMQEKVERLVEKRNAIILAHNYQRPEVQDIADYVGDSLELSQKAAEADAELVVFCGVRFMAETASILCPEKRVLMPDINADCPMANMITPNDLRRLKKRYPLDPVVCYVNSTAETKAESNVCCTSSNAVNVVNSLNASEVIFIPDKYLAHYVSTKARKNIIPWNGFCPTHVRILPQHIQKQRKLHPAAKVMVHPECTPQVIALADRVLSTGGMIKYAKENVASEYIVGTEIGILHRLKKENPDKKFFPASNLAICPNMKLITLEKILWSLEDMKQFVKVPSNVSSKAKGAIEKMLAIG